MRAVMLSLVSVVTLMSVVVTTRQSQALPGKVPYERVCSTCHGDNGQGDAGPRLVPMTMEYDEVLAQVRTGGGEMPPVSKTAMTDDEVKQVFEYLKSLTPPEPKADASRFAMR